MSPINRPSTTTDSLKIGFGLELECAGYIADQTPPPRLGWRTTGGSADLADAASWQVLAGIQSDPRTGRQFPRTLFHSAFGGRSDFAAGASLWF